MVIGIDASRAAIAQRTGTEAYAYFLIKALIPLTVEAGIDLNLYFNQPPPEDLFPENPNTQCISVPLPRLWTHLRLAAELQRRPPDVFFTPAHVIPATYRRASVATIHDLGFFHFPEAHTRQQVTYLRWSTAHNARQSKRIIADSIATKADLLHFYHIDPEKVDVIYPAADPALAAITDPAKLDAVARKYQIQRPYLLYLGTIQPRKNLIQLVKAFLSSQVPHQLVLAGQIGWRAQPLLAYIKALPIEDRRRIILPGYVAETDKAALISGASILLFLSLYEGFGFPILEGQVCETPVLCANTSSLPEITGGAALVVPPDDTVVQAEAINRLVYDDYLRETLIEKGRDNTKRFSWERTAEQTFQTLLKAVD